MEKYSIGFIGGGRITKILITGWRRVKAFTNTIVVTDTNAEVLSALSREFPEAHCTLNNACDAASQPIVFLALHPPAIASLLPAIVSVMKKETIIVSLAPKIPLARLSDGLGGHKNIARIIPNAPSIVNAGYNPVSFAKEINAESRQVLLDLFRLLGEIPEVEEASLEAYAMITGMGPTYFWFQLYELQKLAMSFGLSARAAEEGISSMLHGAVQTMIASGLSPVEVMDLIPVKPLGDEEAMIMEYYQKKLTTLYNKLKG